MTVALWTRASFLLVLDLRHAEFMYFNTTTLQYKGEYSVNGMVFAGCVAVLCAMYTWGIVYLMVY